MRHMLGILPALAILPAAAWSAASLFIIKSSPAPAKSTAQQFQKPTCRANLLFFRAAFSGKFYWLVGNAAFECVQPRNSAQREYQKNKNEVKRGDCRTILG